MTDYGEDNQKDFIRLIGAILRLRNILAAFDDFSGDEILGPLEVQDYQSIYLDLFAEFRRESDAEKESINDDVVFEIELIKQVEVNVDYVLMLVRKYLEENGPGEDKEVRAAIDRAVDSSPSLRNKTDLIVQFVDSVTVDTEVDDQWKSFIAAKQATELDQIIADEGLHPEETQAFIDMAFRDGVLTTAGTAITRILPPVSRFSANNVHSMKKQAVFEKLAAFLDRYFGLG